MRGRNDDHNTKRHAPLRNSTSLLNLIVWLIQLAAKTATLNSTSGMSYPTCVPSPWNRNVQWSLEHRGEGLIAIYSKVMRCADLIQPNFPTPHINPYVQTHIKIDNLESIPDSSLQTSKRLFASKIYINEKTITIQLKK